MPRNKSSSQFRCFVRDVERLIGRRKIRLLYVWLSRAFVGIAAYRLERSLYLLLPRVYGVVRIPLIPIFSLIQAFSNIDIPYNADIAGGLLILHPSVGVVITGKAMIGKDLTLTGGNVIGIKGRCEAGDFVIGDYCTLGANATIIGPLKLADHISVGASACVVKDCEIDHSVLVGVPAKVV